MPDLHPAHRELLRQSSSTIRPLGSEQDVACGNIRMRLPADESARRRLLAAALRFGRCPTRLPRGLCPLTCGAFLRQLHHSGCGFIYGGVRT